MSGKRLNHYSTKNKNVWVVLISGKLDDTYVVDMAYGTDGRICKGFYFLRSSGERFEIEGEEVNGQLVLVESTNKGKSTGFIVGKFDGQNFNGQWMNIKKTISYQFQDKTLKNLMIFIPFCVMQELGITIIKVKLTMKKSTFILTKTTINILFTINIKTQLVVTR